MGILLIPDIGCGIGATAKEQIQNRDAVRKFTPRLIVGMVMIVSHIFQCDVVKFKQLREDVIFRRRAGEIVSAIQLLNQ